MIKTAVISCWTINVAKKHKRARQLALRPTLSIVCHKQVWTLEFVILVSHGNFVDTFTFDKFV